MGSNLNQLAHQANIFGVKSVEDAVLELMEQISEVVQAILRPDDRRRYEMYYDVKSSLAEATSFTDFQIRLDRVGIKTVFKRSSKSGDLQGITFKRDGYSIKGSKLDRSLSLIGIMKNLPRDNKIQREEPHTLYRFVSLEEIQAMEAERQKSLRETKHESHQESHQESRAQELAASLFEGNLGKSQEQEMKEYPLRMF